MSCSWCDLLDQSLCSGPNSAGVCPWSNVVYDGFAKEGEAKIKIEMPDPDGPAPRYTPDCPGCGNDMPADPPEGWVCWHCGWPN
jgi:hypothetical protein